MSDITIGGYLPGDSVLHRLDARTKIVGFILMLAAVFVHPEGGGITATGVAIICLMVMSRLGWKVWWRGLLRFSWMVGITAGLNIALSSYGTPIEAMGLELPFTREGIRNGLLFSIQLLEAISLSMALTFCTAPAELTKGILKLATPLKRLGLPVQDYGMVVLLAMRFVPLVQLEVRTIVDAQKSRGVNFGSGSLVTRGRSLLAILVPALTAILRRADLLAETMSARGYSPGQSRTEYLALEFRRIDLVAGICLILFFLGRFTLFV